MIELSLFGLLAGFFGGFFGIGGGMVLVPMLVWYKFDMKEAISISIIQMVFTSVFGSFLNSKKNANILKDGLYLGSGGFIGGLGSGFIVSYFSSQFLQYLFLAIVALAIFRVFITPTDQNKQILSTSGIKLFIIGIVIGMIAMSIGVGGSIMLMPILVGFLHYQFKYASSLGLFFVIFSSIAGFLSLSLAGHMMYINGAIVGIASLFGVYFGIYLKQKVNITSYKNYILALYVIIFISMIADVYL